MQAEAECERLTNLAIEQQSLREADAERSGRKHKFGSKEDFLERVPWFVDTCRARAEDGSTGGQAPRERQAKGSIGARAVARVVGLDIRFCCWQVKCIKEL